MITLIGKQIIAVVGYYACGAFIQILGQVWLGVKVVEFLEKINMVVGYFNTSFPVILKNQSSLCSNKVE